MAEISRFFGIIIRIYTETGVQHHFPHFHAYYQEEVAAFRIDTGGILAGAIPNRQRKLVEAWIELYREELQEDWQRAMHGDPVFPIPPLKK